MLKKLRRRFIAVAMVAFSAVVIVLLGVIQVSNYHSITAKQDTILQIMHRDLDNPNSTISFGRFPILEYDGLFQLSHIQTIRFFIVKTNSKQEIKKINQEPATLISEKDAINYTTHVLSRNRTKGYYKQYRYFIKQTPSGNTIYFLDSENELELMKSLFLSTISIAVCSLVVIFFLVLIFSKKAIAPFVRNIETQKRFITDAGHELKTPLTAIVTSADVLSMEDENNEWIQNIQQQSSRMAKLIGELITLSRLDEERPFLNITKFVLTEAVWEISEPFASLAKAKGKNYTQQIEENVIVNGDRNAIQQMLSILLDNALKYSDEHGSIHLDVHKKHKKIEMVLYNTCLSDKMPDLDHIFDRFYRAEQSRTTRDSYGIGLSIAQSIIQNHGGAIKATSKDGRSVTFTIIL